MKTSSKIFKASAQLLFLFIAVIFVSEIIVLWYAYKAQNIQLTRPFGNSEKSISQISDTESEKFSFALIGDTEGCGTFERIYEFLKDENLSFMVFLGDVVRRSNHGEHQFLVSELEKEIKSPVPALYIVGNHDIGEKNYPLKKFEKIYGPTNFNFSYNNCLFIGLRILEAKDYSTGESIVYLEKILQEKRAKYSKVFVFFHIPPPITDSFVTKETENPGELISLFNKYNVDYVCMGDYHGYRRIKIKNTNYIVSGGGGGHLIPSKYGCFHHCIIMEVSSDTVEEKIIKFERDQDLEDIIEHSALAEIYPWMKRNPLITILVNFVFLALMIYFWRRARCGQY